jgi:hypothetical protein
VHTIISGGQTGADRAAWDAAIELGLEIGGWVPKGRWAEDGPIAESYRGLRETDSATPSERTRHNVREADATLIVSHGPLAGGSALTMDEALRAAKPVLHIDLQTMDPAVAAHAVREWLDTIRPRVLNVAGPRASEDPTIYDSVAALLRAAVRSS